MSLLKPATNQTAFLKAGILGFQASGKTFTAMDIALGLSKLIGNTKPIAFFDSETGSDFFVKRVLEETGQPMLVAKSRAFKDLLTFMDEAEQVASVAVIDSITHVWQEIMRAYKRKKNRPFLTMQDWGPIKDQWQEFPDRYVNSKLHVIMCGRAGYQYDDVEGDDGETKVTKTGTKMKAEGDTGFEPSLLLEMERLPGTGGVVRGKRSQWIHRCHVLKDRTDLLNGQHFDNPEFADFKPFIDFLNLGGEHVGVDTTRDSQSLFDGPRSRENRKKQVEIALELIRDAFVEADLASTSQVAKKAVIDHLKAVFGTSAWSMIETLTPEQLEDGRKALRARLFNEDARDAVERLDDLDRAVPA